jgi:hypothetical protein
MIYTGIIFGAVCLLGLCLHRPLPISHVQAACEDTGRGQGLRQGDIGLWFYDLNS